MSLIKAENISFSYVQTGTLAINNISFEIKEGEFCAIVGANGSGKSTLAHLITGLQPLGSGKISVENNVPIGLVFQNPKNQIVSGIVNRDTAFGPKNLGLPKSEIELRTIECLNIVDLLEKAESSTLNLSLGQTQKLALGGMLATWPKILILDEAVAMLDPNARKTIFDFLSYWHRHGNTVIHITHDLDAVKQAQHVIGLKNGEIFFDGAAKEFLASKELVHNLTGDDLVPCNRREENLLIAQKNTVFGFSNVSFSYEGEEKNAIENLSFKLREGTLTALTGPSGSGKSTILELGSGLLKPNQGDIFGSDFASIALQNCQDAVFEAFAADDVAFGPRNLGVSGEELKLRVRLAMDSVNLPFQEFGEKPVSSMSGGQLRRLAIAGIIAMDRPVLFFDEPTAGLDGQSRQEVMNLLKKLADEGKTVLFSTHSREEAAFAQREIAIERGKVVYDSFANIKENQAMTKVSNPLVPKEVIGRLSSLRSLSNTLAGVSRKKIAVVEKIHPTLRILLFTLLFVVSLVFKSPLISGIMLALSLLYCLLCGFGPKGIVTSFFKILPFLAFFALFQLIFRSPLPGEVHYTSWKWFLISPSKLWFCLGSLLRTYASLYCISGFYTSIEDYELIDGLRILFYPLEKIRIPMRYLYIVLEILFRFIPLLVDQACGIMKTQIIRGSMGKVKGKLAGIKAIVPLIVPLIIQTVRRSEALADAITMRCFK